MKNQNKMLFASGLLLFLTPTAFTAEPAPAKPAPAAATSSNILINGDFEAAEVGEGWTSLKGNGVSIREEGGNHFLSLSTTGANAAKNVDVKQIVRFAPPAAGTKWVLSGRVRVKSATPGTADWHSIRVQTTWLTDENQPAKPWPASPAFKEVTPDWTPFKVTLTVPPTATQLQIAPAIYQSLGEADFDDLDLRPQSAPAKAQ